MISQKLGRRMERVTRKSRPYYRGFPASLSASFGHRRDLTDARGTMFLKLPERPNKSNHAFYSLKMLKGYYLNRPREDFRSCPHIWMNSGMMRNGVCLTVKTTDLPLLSHTYIIGHLRGRGGREIFSFRREKKIEGEILQNKSTW